MQAILIAVINGNYLVLTEVTILIFILQRDEACEGFILRKIIRSDEEFAQHGFI